MDAAAKMLYFGEREFDTSSPDGYAYFNRTAYSYGLTL
jgi:hypothetical protein